MLSVALKSDPPAACSGAPLRIALAGFGIVGQALARRLAREPDFEIVAILVRDKARARTVHPPCPPTDDRAAFHAVPADILVDVLSCDTTGESLSLERLAAGQHVVSASKRVVARAHGALAGLAATHGGSLRYSAAVGGAAPVLETVAAARAAGGVAEVAAILNGTVNFILDRLAAGADFASALAEARAAGFAEEDSSSDLEGHDAAAKLKLIAAEAFDADPAAVDVRTEPLDAALADRIRGSRWIQVSRLTRAGAEVTLRPACEAGVPALPGEWNAARVTAADGRLFECAGRGAGGAPTAEAIMGDLCRLREAARC
jgi:homoserine dehydrogenase